MSDRSNRIKAAVDLPDALTFLAREAATRRRLPISGIIAEMTASRTWYHHRSGKGLPDLNQLKTYARVLCESDEERDAFFDLASKTNGTRGDQDMIAAALEGLDRRPRDLVDPRLFLEICDILLDPKTRDLGNLQTIRVANALEKMSYRELRKRRPESDIAARKFVIGHRLGLVADQLDNLEIHSVAVQRMEHLADSSPLARGSVLDFEAMFISSFDQVWSPTEDIGGATLRDQFLSAEKLYSAARTDDIIHNEFGFPDQVTAAGLNACRMALQFETDLASIDLIEQKIIAIDKEDRDSGVGPSSLAHNEIEMIDVCIARKDWEVAIQRLQQVKDSLASAGALTEYWSHRLNYFSIRILETRRGGTSMMEESLSLLLECAAGFGNMGNERRAFDAYRRAKLRMS